MKLIIPIFLIVCSSMLILQTIYLMRLYCKVGISKEQYKQIVTDAWNRGRFAERRTVFGYNIQTSFQNDTAYLNSQYDSLMIGKPFKPLYK